ILGKMIPYVALGMLSWLASLVIVFGFFRTPMRGSWGIMILLSLVFLFFIASISLFISTMARRSIDATQYAMVVALPSFLLCGYTWPMVAMTGIYKIIGHLFPITYFAVNVRNIALMDAGIQQIAPDMAVMIVLSIIFIQLSNLRGTLLFGALYPQGKLNEIPSLRSFDGRNKPRQKARPSALASRSFLNLK
ncbi:MAG: ABC transporter permease, partial [Negativicutes bacterium]|nr:ABC transporter permease [Negativicutes bacterium]